ncbi:MAG TPA: hypothetical protein VNF74_01310 [Terriglobales bacterium]|nr:hypothetical protein [Terriglobales bacterium]
MLVGFLLMLPNRVCGLVLPTSTKYLIDSVIVGHPAGLLAPILRFAYADGPEVLHEGSLAAAPGTMTALVRPSGSGKVARRPQPNRRPAHWGRSLHSD